MSRSRRELAHFLRSRRARLIPTDVGLPPGPRRRIPGLRREEIAVLAGFSPTWYTYLEQGRDIRPSPEVLDSLARVLRLDEDERRYLHLLANGQVPQLGPEDDDARLDGLQELVDTVGQTPYPVMALNALGDLRAWNPAAVDWYVDFDRLPVEQRNLLLWMLNAPEARQRVLDWEADARDMLARFRLAVARRPWDPRSTEVIGVLRRSSREFRDWWSDHDVRGERSSIRRVRLDDGSVCAARLVVLQLVDGFHSLVVHIPVSAQDLDGVSPTGARPAS